MQEQLTPNQQLDDVLTCLLEDRGHSSLEDVIKLTKRISGNDYAADQMAKILRKLVKDGNVDRIPLQKYTSTATPFIEDRYAISFEGEYFIKFNLGYCQRELDDKDKALRNELEKQLFQRQIQSTIDTNESVSRTNDSVRNINDNIIPRFNTTQKRLGILTLAVAGFSLISLTLSTCYASKGATSSDIESLRQSIQSSTSALDSIRQVEKGIDSSLRKAVSDPLKRK